MMLKLVFLIRKKTGGDATKHDDQTECDQTECDERNNEQEQSNDAEVSVSNKEKTGGDETKNDEKTEQDKRNNEKQEPAENVEDDEKDGKNAVEKDEKEEGDSKGNVHEVNEECIHVVTQPHGENGIIQIEEIQGHFLAVDVNTGVISRINLEEINNFCERVEADFKFGRVVPLALGVDNDRHHDNSRRVIACTDSGRPAETAEIPPKLEAKCDELKDTLKGNVRVLQCEEESEAVRCAEQIRERINISRNMITIKTTEKLPANHIEDRERFRINLVEQFRKRSTHSLFKNPHDNGDDENWSSFLDSDNNPESPCYSKETHYCDIPVVKIPKLTNKKFKKEKKEKNVTKHARNIVISDKSETNNDAVMTNTDGNIDSFVDPEEAALYVYSFLTRIIYIVISSIYFNIVSHCS